MINGREVDLDYQSNYDMRPVIDTSWNEGFSLVASNPESNSFAVKCPIAAGLMEPRTGSAAPFSSAK